MASTTVSNSNVPKVNNRIVDWSQLKRLNPFSKPNDLRGVKHVVFNKDTNEVDPNKFQIGDKIYTASPVLTAPFPTFKNTVIGGAVIAAFTGGTVLGLTWHAWGPALIASIGLSHGALLGIAVGAAALVVLGFAAWTAYRCVKQYHINKEIKAFQKGQEDEAKALSDKQAKAATEREKQLLKRDNDALRQAAENAQQEAQRLQTAGSGGSNASGNPFGPGAENL